MTILFALSTVYLLFSAINYVYSSSVEARGRVKRQSNEQSVTTNCNECLSKFALHFGYSTRIKIMGNLWKLTLKNENSETFVETADIFTSQMLPKFCNYSKSMKSCLDACPDSYEKTKNSKFMKPVKFICEDNYSKFQKYASCFSNAFWQTEVECEKICTLTSVDLQGICKQSACIMVCSVTKVGMLCLFEQDAVDLFLRFMKFVGQSTMDGIRFSGKTIPKECEVAFGKL